MKHPSVFKASSFILLSLSTLALPHPSTKPADIEVAPAGESSWRLATEPKDDDPLTQEAKHADDDPDPDMGSLQLIEAVGVRDEQEWESAFSADMGSTFRGAADAVTVPFEYMPNSQRIPDGFGIVQMLANAALRAKLPCGSIYTVGSLPQPAHGWILLCDHKQHAYSVMFVGHDWKLRNLSSVRSTVKR
jgi:hypothetical protein